MSLLPDLPPTSTEFKDGESGAVFAVGRRGSPIARGRGLGVGANGPLIINLFVQLFIRWYRHSVLCIELLCDIP